MTMPQGATYQCLLCGYTTEMPHDCPMFGGRSVPLFMDMSAQDRIATLQRAHLRLMREAGYRFIK